MNRIVNIVFVVLRLFLGGMMVYGGVKKFSKPLPSPIEMSQIINQCNSPEKENTLRKVQYIGGLKQTGYFWQVLGICELLFGLLLLIQFTGFVGAVFLLPISLHIFLFHFFLEPDDIGELIETAALLVTNIALVFKERTKVKALLWIRPL